MKKSLGSGRFHYLFNLKDEKAKGRFVMLSSSILSSLVGILTGGLFYTSFLMENGINLVNIGIITFVPYIANCFAIFSPSILERFPKRRFVLAAGRMTYYLLNILAVTIMPMLVKDQQAKMVLFVVLIFAANIISALFSSGYTAWHLNFIPNDIRAEYFSTVSTISNFLSWGGGLVFSLIADSFSSSPYAYTVIVVLRFLGFLMAVAEILALLSPVEYPYERGAQKPKFKDILVKPFQHRRFVLTMLLIFIYNVGNNIPASSLNYYLIDNVGVSYTLIQLLNLAYPFCMLFFLPVWKRFLRKEGWIRTFAISVLITLPTHLAYSCVTKVNFLWLLPIVRLTQHFTMMGGNIAFSNLAFLNMPTEDQTNYIAFDILAGNFAAFLGMFCGTSFVNQFPDLTLSIGSLQFVNVQILMWVQTLVLAGVAIAALKYAKCLTPDQ